jgi:hypothetical protein
MFNTILIGSGCAIAGGLIVKFWRKNEGGLVAGGDALVDRIAPEWCHEKAHQIVKDAVAWGHDLFNDPKYVAQLLRLAVSSNFNLKDALVKWATSIDWTKKVEDQLPPELKEAARPMMNQIKLARVTDAASGGLSVALPPEVAKPMVAKVDEMIEAQIAAGKIHQPKSTEQLLAESIERQKKLEAHK